MPKNLKSEEKIIIQIDPFSGEIAIQNMTRYPSVDVNIAGEIDAGKEKPHTLTLSAEFEFKRKS